MYDLEKQFVIYSEIETRWNFNTVLKSYTSRKDKDLNKSMEYANKFNLQNIIRKYLEILL